jgi:hypothetical protein
MGPRVGDLEPRQLERWRAQIVEAIGAHLAYPPFYDYRSGREAVRPLDRAKRDELDQFVRSANFSPLEASDLTSPDVRRFLERLLLRYLDVNPVLQGAARARRTAALRAHVPKIAADIHRSLLGSPVQAATASPRSWRPDRREGRRGESTERNTRVLEAILTRGEEEGAAPTAVAGGSQPPGSQDRRSDHGSRSAMTERWVRPTDATIPVPAHDIAPSGISPFASFGAGAQSGIFAPGQSVSDRPTGPLPAVRAAAPSATPSLPEDLYQLYGDYLRDMQPEADATVAHPAVAVAPPVPSGPASPRRAASDGPGPRLNGADRRSHSAPAGPDVQIFFQLRYQLEAYVRRAVRGYGVRARSDDAFSQLDALRSSGFVDEADLRLAEGILAVTDKVVETGSASVEDFRQAMMLYLLYHRSHLGS